MMNHDFLVIEGNIGAGKTTFARMLSEEFDAKLILSSLLKILSAQILQRSEKYSSRLSSHFWPKGMAS